MTPCSFNSSIICFNITDFPHLLIPTKIYICDKFPIPIETNPEAINLVRQELIKYTIGKSYWLCILYIKLCTLYVNFELIEYEDLQDYKELNKYVKDKIQDIKLSNFL